MPEKKIEPNGKEILEKENIIRSKVKKEMLHLMEKEKETVRKDAEDYYNK